MTLHPVLSKSYARLSQCAVERCVVLRDWLSLAERAELDCLGHDVRRRQWLAGRWLAKQLIRRAIGGVSLPDIQLLARDERGRGVRPRIRVPGRKLPWSVSISHSEHGVLVALAASESLSVGVDLADLRPDRAARFGAGFRRLWFTPCEQRWLDVDPPRRIATLWALKEAVYKACNAGESFFPQQIEIVPLESDGFRCRYRGLPLEPISLNVCDLDGHVAAVVQMPIVHALTQSNGATPRRQDMRAMFRPQPVAALPATVLPTTVLPAKGNDVPQTLRFAGDRRFDHPSIPQPVATFRKPS